MCVHARGAELSPQLNLKAQFREPRPRSLLLGLMARGRVDVIPRDRRDKNWIVAIDVSFDRIDRLRNT